MRTYGRINQVDGVGGTWVEVDTDSAGNDDDVWLTTLIQCLKLGLGESPFYSQYGIPAQQSVLQQIFPDFNVYLTQKQFSPYFASLVVAKIPDPAPMYRINIITNAGVKKQVQVPV